MLFSRQKRPRIITGLDIGTTKVCTIIGQADPEGKLTILGMGSCPSKGLRCGEIIDLEPTINAIVQATNQASDLAGASVGEIYIGISGDHVDSQNIRAMVEIRHPARAIDERDRRRAIEKAKHSLPVPEEKALIHAIIQEFRINGGNPITNPIGLCGSNLEVSAHLVTTDANPIRNIVRCLRRAGLRQSPHIVLQALASSISVITPTERELGTVLVDIGGGTTDVAISTAGAIRATTEISLGGDHITRDVAQVLNCSLNDAENAKKRHGCALPQMIDRNRTFNLPSAGDPQHHLKHEEYLLAEVIEARLEEIFRIVGNYIERTGFHERTHGGIVLTGGSSLLPGITDVAERILDSKCRCGSPQGLKGLGTVVNSPIYATGIGLILYGIEADKQSAHCFDATVLEPGTGGGIRRLLGYLVEHFR